MKNDVVYGFFEGVGKEKMLKKCWGEYVILFNVIFDWEGIFCLVIILDSLLYVFVGGYK